MKRILMEFLTGIVRNLGIAWRLMHNPSVPLWVRILLPVPFLTYYLSPVDLLPGIPLDDLLLLLVVFPRLMIRLSPPAAVETATYGGTLHTRQEEDENTIDVPWRTVS